MKNISLALFCVLSLSACGSSIELISKTKQTIYPGFRTQKIYTNYMLKFSINTDEIINIDSIQVLQKQQLYKVEKYLIKKGNSASYINNITKKGNYSLEIPLKENNITKLETNLLETEDELIIYYQEGGKVKTLLLNNFTEERVSRR